MLKHIIAIGCIIVCTTLASSRSAKTNKHFYRSQHHKRTIKQDLSDINESFEDTPTFSDRTSLRMLEDITAKVWRTLPVINVPQSWVLAYCLRYTEISAEIEKAIMQCQYDGTDWDCTFIELGGGQDDFNMGKIVSLFDDISNRGLKVKLLRATEICGRLWQRYKEVQDKRLIRMKLNIHVHNRGKRSLRKNRNSRGWRKTPKKWKKKKEEEYDREIQKRRWANKKVKAIQQELTNKITRLENKNSLSPQEEIELDRLRLTMQTKPPIKLEEFSLAEERTELSRLRETGSCLTQQAGKACESVVLEAVQKLM